MYVARFDRRGLLWDVRLFEKKWSEQMFSNEVVEISTHRFLFHSSAKKWVRNEIVKEMVRHHGLEIING